VAQAAVHGDDERTACPPGRGEGDRQHGEVLAVVAVNEVNVACEPQRGVDARNAVELASRRDRHSEAMDDRVLADPVAACGTRRAVRDHRVPYAALVQRARELTGVALHAADRIESHAAAGQSRVRRREHRAQPQHPQRRALTVVPVCRWHRPRRYP
jgi:hypothetical protein